MTIPAQLIEQQSQASDPATSAWVSANAGAGKTHVLAQRVIRLLLDGVDPAKILCLTFTKAAAANMANRVFTTLAHWTTLDDDALDKAIAETGAKRGGARQRASARKLFAAALDTPGGLKVQTIHGFCAGLLQQFPFEANVAARFRVMESPQQQQLLEQIKFGVLLEAAGGPESPLGRALETCVSTASDFAFQTALDEAIGEREHLTAWRADAGEISEIHADVSRALGVDPDETAAQLEEKLFSQAVVPPERWPALIDILAHGSDTDRKHGRNLAIAATATGTARREAYLLVYLNKDRTQRKAIVTKAIREKFPAVFEKMAQEQQRVIALLARQRAVALRDRTVALVTIADTVLARYRAEKDRRGLLDFEDLIVKTRSLLARVESAWVHYKLDLGIDHLLIDEAQDTSPAQWDIITKLVAEFTAGAGARGTLKRSIFAVGDDKQSIFSFQGAAPDTFDEMRRQFEREHAAAELPFVPLRFVFSFRSVPVVLGAVDTVFSQEAAYTGLSVDEVKTVHSAVREKAPGLVELWPLVEPEGKDEPEAWDAPFDTTSQASPRVVLAQRIATAIGTWRARSVLIGDDDKRHPVRPGDILILVRQRGALFEAIIRALKNAHIPVAGADRLVLTEHIAVMDLLALADAVLLPQDDLALATVLKSPLFGFSEENLFQLAHGRNGTLRAELRVKHSDVAARLDAVAARAGEVSPFSWFAELLGTGLLTSGGARKAFLARLGHEANDPIDEFLNLTLDYESREIATLQGFVTWLRRTSADIKRDMEMVRNEVRVMTVHGAKGLEAPLVILADTTSEPAGPAQHRRRLLSLAARDAPPGTPDRLIWVPNKDADVDVTANARDAETIAAENEHRRLLYVAMTRAADRLIVCGEIGKRNPPNGCWYQLVEQALTASGELTEQPAAYGDGMVRQFRKSPDTDECGKPDTPQAAAADLAPAWLRHDAPSEPRRRTLTPSSDDAASFIPAKNADNRRLAMQRGVVAHRLLQSLPNVAPERRRTSAEAYLARAAKDFAPDERATILDQTLALINDARFATLFGPGSRGEVPIVGRLACRSGALAVTGQVDRLIVTETEVWIADFKTNRPPPRGIAEVPPAYVRQLSIYRAVLAQIYPGLTIRCALIWTEVPDLMELPADELDRKLDAIISS
jgi:ATP-dependent helicase/nuclease subunit A